MSEWMIDEEFFDAAQRDKLVGRVASDSDSYAPNGRGYTDTFTTLRTDCGEHNSTPRVLRMNTKALSLN